MANVSAAAITPKAFASQPSGWSAATTLGDDFNYMLNPEGFANRREPFQGLIAIWVSVPGFSLHSNPGLTLANAFGVIATALTLANTFGVIAVALTLADAFGAILRGWR